MGNCMICIKPESEAMWGGEDWTSAMKMVKEEEEEEEEEELVRSYWKETQYSSSNVKEVKVKITKKQLEKWLGKMDCQQKRLCVEQALAQLIKVSVHCKTHHRSWKPMLQTIPEV
ncbi:uncharacterized protein [Spinacia oleracea]|uniref:Uncharacterized protein n=1 Tax=Spinacia oleracea TaxID=3562 RepID=A0A9R0J567_SPIOL|nr:uncharacterized protein LOC110799736 [Spinacia oleracea]